MDKIILQQSVIHKIMNRGIIINKENEKTCRDFQIMISEKFRNTLILRWTCIDISNADNPIQRYHYECFKTDGTPQLCSIYYTNQEEANEFIWSLQPLYHQKYAIDHKL
ncbi:hypothetical protein [Aquimarina agarivorans]|uniref:hypothetical protein n=1 Tax=Aquimarina agarivorans TaxID=980584 RepID=UPI000248FC43|nr:hypothetical protein [Aquimarina agarivorans]